MPPILVGLDSDDEDDVNDVPAAVQMQQAFAAAAASEAAAGGSGGGRVEESFMLSQSGTFKVQDFNINRSGLKAVGPKENSPEAHEQAARSVEISSMTDLETMGTLGQGASGVVFSAKHKLTGEMFAVKEVNVLDKAKRDQVVAELRIMMTHTRCPWLVTLYNAFHEEARVYTVLEYMDAGSVADLIEKHRPEGGLRDELWLAKIATQMLNGISYLHTQLHQVHRDLKPANVLINSRGAVKISDFGISSQLESTAGLCETFVGTTCYMSPERLSGTPYSYAADIWSFGIIMVELVSAEYPYRAPEGAADSLISLLSRIMDQQSPTLPETVTCSDQFAEFTSVCLDKEPARRPTARDLLRHPFLRAYPIRGDELLLSGMLEAMSL